MEERLQIGLRKSNRTLMYRPTSILIKEIIKKKYKIKNIKILPQFLRSHNCSKMKRNRSFLYENINFQLSILKKRVLRTYYIR